jgi:YfiR/HmsC-like
MVPFRRIVMNGRRRRRAGDRLPGPASAPRRAAWRSTGRCAAVALLLLLEVVLLPPGGSGPRSASAQPLPPLEYQVKAAFVYQFLSFVEWPAATTPTGDGVIIGILGETPLTAALQPVIARSPRSRPLVVRTLRETRDLAAVHVLFVAASEKERLTSVLRAAHVPGLLTIGEVDGFAQLGGVINFVIVDGKVAFEINVRAAEEAQLKISSKLLRLARIVEQKG